MEVYIKFYLVKSSGAGGGSVMSVSGFNTSSKD